MGNKIYDADPGIRKSLGDLLVEEKLITQDQLELALVIQNNEGKLLSEILLNRKMVKPEELAAILSVQLNLPYIDLQRHTVQPDALRLIPETIARKNTLIPLDIIGDSLMVVMADPRDIQTIQDIQARVKMKVEVAIGISTDILKAIDINYRSSAEIEKRINEFTPGPPPIVKSVLTGERTALTPIAQTVELIIKQAVRDRASDIHIEPQLDRLRIRFRIDGILQDMFSLPISTHNSLVSRIKIMAEMNIAEQRRPQDGQISYTVGDKEIDIRVASLATAYGERLSLRILDKSLAVLTLSELGLLPDSLNKFETMAKSPYGLFLIGGPTGSGKTTTLYSLINSINRLERNIMTIEDPIEYHFPDINQTQVNIKSGITFASGLKALIRHDPNVIMVGEIRDAETASIAVQASLTGHLVISSIHANDSVGVLFRLLNLGIEPYLIVSTLIGITTQRLVRRFCPHCRKTSKLTAVEASIYEKESLELPENTYTVGSGCNLCSNTGYQGRTGIFEVMPITSEVRKMLVNNVNSVDIEKQVLKEGLITLIEDGMRKVKQGDIPLDEVLRNVISRS